jgi:hypothetical protein
MAMMNSFSTIDGNASYTLANALQQQTKYQQRLLESLRTSFVSSFYELATLITFFDGSFND